MLSGKYLKLYEEINQLIPAERLLHDDLSTLAFGTDASFYRLMPKLVVKVHNEAEVIALFKSCFKLNIPVTGRGSGTSLSGQAITDSVLMLVVPSEWRKYQINGDASEITLQPGVIGAKANQYLQPFGKKIGPDPASINSAQIGGIVANNASGMSSGTKFNSYNTLSGMRIILNDGTLLDTRDRESCASFLQNKKELAGALEQLAGTTTSNKNIKDRITEKFAIKNTTGYSVNALTDFKKPLEIIPHLMVGSEGTLGFISEVTLKTVDDPPEKAASLVFFPDIASACEAVAVLKTCSVAAAELMDRASLRAVENKKAMPSFIKELDDRVTALLVETRAADKPELQKQVEKIGKSLERFPLVKPLSFTTDANEIAALWSVRKGLFPSVCAEREKGTTVIIEDIAVPYASLATVLVELQDLFKKYYYDDAIIWGHAFDGNVHFVLIQNFSEASEVQRYENFIDELVEVIVDKYHGSLKAEHGTGRNMAPFVQREWGAEIYEIMRQVKQIFDAQGILNPGVVLNDDQKLHLKNLKPMPAAHPLIDACIECGFCEINCVSVELTLSPRQRIVAYREISELIRTGQQPQRLAQLRDRFDYQGNQTCATDGLCALSCPVDIDTGSLIKELRQNTVSARASKIADLLSDNMDRLTAAARLGLAIVHIFHRILGTRLMNSITNRMRSISGNRIPRWTPFMPANGHHAKPKAADSDNPLKVVYFSSCITRSMGASDDYDEQVSLTEKTESLLGKAGYDIIYPENINQLCCGMAFASKGFKEAGDRKAAELDSALLKASQNGKYPVLADMSPCLYRMKETLSPALKLYEPIEFTLAFLKDRLVFHKTQETIAIHSVCSAKKMGLDNEFLELAELCSDNVVVAESNCCGFAGDRGFTYPELTESGLKHLKEQIPGDCKQGYSTSRTCEIGLSEYSGISFKSILYLVDRCTSTRE